MSKVETFYVLESSDIDGHYLASNGYGSPDLKSAYRRDTAAKLIDDIKSILHPSDIIGLFGQYHIKKIHQVTTSYHPDLDNKTARKLKAYKEVHAILEENEDLAANYGTADEYMRYHIRGGPDRNKYHIAMRVNTDLLEDYVRDLDRFERKELVGVYDYWETSKILTLMLKPLGIRFPDCKYNVEEGVVYFLNKSQPMMFKLKYGIDFLTLDFAEIYRNSQRDQ